MTPKYRKDLVAAAEAMGLAVENAEGGGAQCSVGPLGLSFNSRAAKAPARKFSAKAFPAPIDEALRVFDALAPVESMRVGPKGAWTLEFRRPLAWPLFLRCDLAASFVPKASALTVVLRDANVVALDFDGEALWARFVA